MKRMHSFGAALAALLIAQGSFAREDAAEDGVGYPTVAAARAALERDAAAQFDAQDGWTIVATRERGNPVLWSFTPEGHPAHPAVVKRTALERGGVGVIDLVVLCHTEQAPCDRLLDRFRQVQQEINRAAIPDQVMLDVGIAVNDRDRVHVKRLRAEAGKAAEIRMDDVFKVVIVPSVGDFQGVKLWTAVYEFDGADYVLLGEPALATSGEGGAQLEVASERGNSFRFLITPLLAGP